MKYMNLDCQDQHVNTRSREHAPRRTKIIYGIYEHGEMKPQGLCLHTRLYLEKLASQL